MSIISIIILVVVLGAAIVLLYSGRPPPNNIMVLVGIALIIMLLTKRSMREEYSDLVQGPCAPNLRDAVLSRNGPGCVASYPNSVMRAAQFNHNTPQTTDPAFSPEPPNRDYRVRLKSPDIILDNGSERPPVIPPRNHNPSVIPAGQPKFYCKFDPDCSFEPLGEKYVSMNQKLVGPANPKTLISPRIPLRLYDLPQWTSDPFVNFPQINDQFDQELYQSGYLVSTPPPQVRESYEPPEKIPVEMIQKIDESAVSVLDKTMDLANGYFPENTRHNTYVNSPYEPSPNTQCQDSQDSYNRDIGIIPIQPGVNFYSQVNQPDAMMSNLGISFTQPHLPTIPYSDKNGDIDFVEYDPLQVPKHVLASSLNQPDDAEPDRIDITDPRLTGYGSSYRGYIDELTGQPRFYYDDIEGVAQYNYITRNDIDFSSNGLHAGPSPHPTIKGYPSLDDVRCTADRQFADLSIFQRTDLQERLMQKSLHRERQRREAPIHTMATGRC